MGVRLDRGRIAALVRESITEVNRGRGPEEQIPTSDETPIVADDSPMDSLAFVSFSASLEDRLRDELAGDLPVEVGDLWSEESALRDVRTLTDRLVTLLG